MNEMSWIEKKQCLIDLIKKISMENGGDDILWLDGYIEEVIRLNKDNLDESIQCFDSLKKEFLSNNGQDAQETVTTT